MANIYFYNMRLGKIGISEENGNITNIFLADSYDPSLGYIEKETEIIKKTSAQLNEYFEGKRKSFDLPLSPNGTPFEKKVWNALLEIPYGKTKSYKEIAQKIGNPKACRAVGNANGKNHIAIIIPCHRVIASNGGLGGYSSGLEYKKALLEIEKNR
ncbi:MAG: methylated-DNA--[protein]-cysteine S-methyltransferase [Lachnospiraceae bacterium]|nr:methylated-DNA--[protein]-cysteine S-methyltransferase [Lachnospiraceae bacterium]